MKRIHSHASGDGRDHGDDAYASFVEKSWNFLS